MTGKGRNGRDRLERIAALLLALAGLAERAAVRSAPVRILVLWLLRRAEEVAAGFVAGEDIDMAADVRPPARQNRGHGPADALALALSLRLLALAVQVLAARDDRLPNTANISACVERLGRLLGDITSALSPIAARRDTS